MGSSGALPNTTGNVTIGGTLKLNNAATIQLGAGLDTDLYRIGANKLGTDGALYLGNIAAPGAIGGFGGLYVTGAGALTYVGGAGTVTTVAPA